MDIKLTCIAVGGTGTTRLKFEASPNKEAILRTARERWQEHVTKKPTNGGLLSIELVITRTNRHTLWHRDSGWGPRAQIHIDNETKKKLGS